MWVGTLVRVFWLCVCVCVFVHSNAYDIISHAMRAHVQGALDMQTCTDENLAAANRMECARPNSFLLHFEQV